MPKPVFYQALTVHLQRALAECGLKSEMTISNTFELSDFFREIESDKIVLLIDEFEGIPDEMLAEVLPTFRQMYHMRQIYGLYSLILVGVSTISELITKPASPFNIADKLELTYFSPAEVRDLIGQYVSESGQPFAEAVIKAIYHDTQGQPGLVCALCHHLVTQVVSDKHAPVTVADFYTLDELSGKKVYTHIVRTAFERPSEVGVPQELKSTSN